MKLASLNTVSRQLPKAHGLLSAGIVGVGSYTVARWLDGMIGNRIQSIGIPLPIIGNLSVLDIILLLSFKASMHKNTQVAAAFIGDRIFNLRFGIPGFGGVGLGVSKNTSTALSGPQGGGF